MLRIMVAGLVVLAALLTVVLGWWLFLWLFQPGLVAAMLATAACSPLVAWLLIAGWSESPVARTAQGVGALVTVGFYAVVAVLLATDGLNAAASRDTLGTPTEEATGPLIVGACAAAMAAVTAAAMPTRPHRRLPVALVAGVIGAGAVASGLAAIAINRSADECGEFRFDRDRWRTALEGEEGRGEHSDAERLAEAIVRCGTFVGASRARVRRALGDGGGGPRKQTWIYSVGWTNDGLGPGDAQELIVAFGRDDRVRDTSLLYSDDVYD